MTAPAITATVTVATVPAVDKPPRRRRWIPMSLWIFVAILVVSAAWGGHRAYRRHVAIQEIERLGGMMSSGPPKPEWLEWLVYRIDQDLGEWFEVVTFACLDGRPATDATLDHLSWLSELDELVLSGTQVTDAGLSHLQGLSNLKRIFLKRTRVTDAGITELKQALPRLTVER